MSEGHYERSPNMPHVQVTNNQYVTHENLTVTKLYSNSRQSASKPVRRVLYHRTSTEADWPNTGQKHA